MPPSQLASPTTSLALPTPTPSFPTPTPPPFTSSPLFTHFLEPVIITISTSLFLVLVIWAVSRCRRNRRNRHAQLAGVHVVLNLPTGREATALIYADLRRVWGLLVGKVRGVSVGSNVAMPDLVFFIASAFGELDVLRFRIANIAWPWQKELADEGVGDVLHGDDADPV
ncbi:MAG: hypothetical protein LQ338_006272 [Usnochroma carphineum]|nr:MAG: hypothetical protein LQ338_006272 [Usnochroma carphineum]